MDKVTVTKEALLAALNVNLNIHVKDYAEMLEQRRNSTLQALNDEVGLIMSNPAHQPAKSTYFAMPEDHTQEYKKAIKMTEMSIYTEIELTERQFDQLIMDNWSWTENNNILKTRYLGKV